MGALTFAVKIRKREQEHFQLKMFSNYKIYTFSQDTPNLSKSILIFEIEIIKKINVWKNFYFLLELQPVAIYVSQTEVKRVGLKSPVVGFK